MTLTDSLPHYVALEVRTAYLSGSSPSPERSCLLVCRSNKGPDVPLSPSTNRHNISQMVFHKIRKEDLEFVSVSGTIVMNKSAAPSV